VNVSEQDVLYVAGLANLELTPAERERMVRDLNSILGYIDRLNELDTANVDPMAQTSDRFGVDAAKVGSACFGYAMRADQPGVVEVTGNAGVMRAERPSLPRAAALKNAPDSDGTFFKVPKVIER
jgi:aspartyl-tRNA(Asn)/glutamyl-tRNA(Gln) amidotransferase subunit C